MDDLTVTGPGRRAPASGEGRPVLRVQALETRLALSGVANEVVHLHAQLSIFVDGQPVTVPADIGVGAGGVLAVHTHDATGKLHIESAQARDFRLRELFDAWGQPFTRDQFLGHAVGPDRTLTMTVNGAATDALGNWMLHDHDNIVIRLDRRPTAGTGDVALQIAHSAEYYLHLVHDFYEDFLGRAPDESGLAYWTESLRQGLPVAQAESLFLTTPEYVVRMGGTGAAWVDAIYRDLLGRGTDAGGRAYWQSQLAGGTDPTGVAHALAAGVERWGLRIGEWYAEHLGRAPSRAEADGWVAQALAGTDVEDLEAAFVGSAEYYHHDAKGQGDPKSWVRGAYRSLLRRPAGDAEANYWAALIDPASAAHHG